MSALILLVAVGFLCGAAFISRRRFGVLGLSLAAGSLISANWAGTLTPFIEKQGVELSFPPLAIVVQAALIMAPPLVLLFSGPSYQKTWQRVVGSAMFAVLAFAFLLTPFSIYIRLDQGQEVYNFFKTYQSGIIVAGLLAALADVLLTRKPAGSHGKHSKH